MKATRRARKGHSQLVAFLHASAPSQVKRAKPPSKRAKPPSKRAKTRLPKKASKPLRPQPGSFVNEIFKDAQGWLSYKLYTPHGSTRRRLPLVVMLHGCKQTASDFAAGTDMNALANELGFLVLYPEQAASANLARCWNWHRTVNQRRGMGEPALIAGLTRHVVTLCKANAARVYIAGISAGGAAAAIVGAAYPDLFVAIGVHSGIAHGNISTLVQAHSAMKNGVNAESDVLRSKTAPLPTIVFHGDQDGTVHPANATGFVSRLQRSSDIPLDVREVTGRSDGGRNFTRSVYRNGDGKVLLESWMIHGSGHAWSGGKVTGSYTDPAGPDASREIARFFLARRRSPRHKALPACPPDRRARGGHDKRFGETGQGQGGSPWLCRASPEDET